MHDFLPFIVTGIATGAVYGMAATGLVLTYKTSGVFNFGYGAIATTVAYFFYWLHVDQNMGWVPALILSVFVGAPLIGLLMERITARLATQRVAAQVVGTVGLILIVQALASIKFGTQTLRFEQFLPHGLDTFRLFGVVVQWQSVIITVVALVAVALLYSMFRFARVGVAMRAVVDDPELLAMQATDPVRVRQFSWIIGAVFAGLSGVLVASLIGLEPIVLTFLVVQAFGAAAVGAFSSIPLTFLGGLLIGIGADVAKKYTIQISWLGGFPTSLPFLVLFVALLVLPRSKLVSKSRIVHRTPLQYRAPPQVRAAMGVLVLIPLLFVPQLVGSKLPFAILGLVTAILLLSLGLLVRMSGQVSLCHAAFAAIGAVAFSQFYVEQGWPWILALLACGLVAVPVGALVAIPAIRLSGLFLALATFGFGILVQRLAYAQSWMFTPLAQGRPVPKPGFARTPESYYYLVLAALVVTSLIVVFIQRSRLGRVLRGLSDAPTAVTALGLHTTVTKVIAFCLSAFLAAIAGALYAGHVGFAVGGDRFFIAFSSLTLLAMLALAPFAEPWFALVPAVTVIIPAYLSGDHTVEWLNFLFGLFAVIISMKGGHPSMPRRMQIALDRLGGRSLESGPPAGLVQPPATMAPAATAGLIVRDLHVQFGGLVAVSDVSFEAPLGRITGLLGPNGAGKTTTFDACGGLNRRFRGTISLHGKDVTALPPHERGRLGLGRTFQRMELGDTLTVLENVELGHESGLAGSGVFSHLVGRRMERRQTQSAAWAALELCEISDLAEAQAGSLSTGQRRLVELARCLAGPFDLLLLDEPSSGLDHDETARFGSLLQHVVAERGVGILLVEHDMSLVMNICDYMYVLDFGKLIFEGEAAAVAASEIVQSAYLGTDKVMESLEPSDIPMLVDGAQG